MKAWISGAAQQAVIREGSSYRLINDSSRKLASISADEVAALIEDWDDAYILSVKSSEEVQEELRRAVHCYDALLASSLTIDVGATDSRRYEAAIEAERLLQEDFAFNHVLNAYCAHPMPYRADLKGAVRMCEKKSLSKLGDVIKTVQLYEGKIRIVREAWDSIKIGTFGGTDERSIFQAEAVRSGLFQSMVKRVGDPGRFEVFHKVVETKGITRLPNAERVLKEWLKGLAKHNAPPADPVPASAIMCGATRITDLLAARSWPSMLHTGVLESTPAFASA